jgi:hypothetical protein
MLAVDHLHHHLSAFLTEYAPVRDTHYLIPLTLEVSLSFNSVDTVLTAISDGSAEAKLDDDDDPSWATAVSLPEQEFWIAGARDELKSLDDLNVFVLVIRKTCFYLFLA